MDIVPWDLFRFKQFRTAIVSSADVELDIAIHLNTELGPNWDLKYRVFAGRRSLSPNLFSGPHLKVARHYHPIVLSLSELIGR